MRCKCKLAFNVKISWWTHGQNLCEIVRQYELMLTLSHTHPAYVIREICWAKCETNEWMRLLLLFVHHIQTHIIGLWSYRERQWNLNSDATRNEQNKIEGFFPSSFNSNDSDRGFIANERICEMCIHYMIPLCDIAPHKFRICWWKWYFSCFYTHWRIK